MKTLACILLGISCGFVLSEPQTIWTSALSETPVSLKPNGETQIQANAQPPISQVPQTAESVLQPNVELPSQQQSPLDLRQVFPPWRPQRPTFVKIPMKSTYLNAGYFQQPTNERSNSAYPSLKFPTSQGNADMFEKLKLLSEYTRDMKVQNMDTPPFLPRPRFRY